MVCMNSYATNTWWIKYLIQLKLWIFMLEGVGKLSNACFSLSVNDSEVNSKLHSTHYNVFYVMTNR